MPLFGFASYLARVLSLSEEEVDIQPLLGALTNVTVRAIFTKPLLASDPSQMMTVHRQVVEAEALAFLAEPSNTGDLMATSVIQVPRLLHHDVKENVLWITDLGETQTLSEYLLSDTPPSSAQVSGIASVLIKFLAEFWYIFHRKKRSRSFRYTRRRRTSISSHRSNSFDRIFA